MLYGENYNGNMDQSDFWEYFYSLGSDIKEEFAKKLGKEIQSTNPTYTIAIDFKYNTAQLGYVFAYTDGYQICSFSPNPFNIHLTVSFVDWDGTELKKEIVAYGMAATAPLDPPREGYIFIGWNKDFGSIKEDLVVIATYEEEVTIEDYEYELTITNTEVIITGYNGLGGDIIIPSEIDGKPVVGIKSGGFYSNGVFYNKNIASVILPETLKFI